jgi:hypothetical protein
MDVRISEAGKNKTSVHILSVGAQELIEESVCLTHCNDPVMVYDDGGCCWLSFILGVDMRVIEKFHVFL